LPFFGSKKEKLEFMSDRRVGFWIVGAKGAVASTAILGLIALRKNLANNIGLVSELEPFSHLDLVRWSQIEIGGHDIRQAPLFDEMTALNQANQMFDNQMLASCQKDIEQVEANIRPGNLTNSGSTISQMSDLEISSDEKPCEVLERIKSDLEHFRKNFQLDSVIMINLSSTEVDVDLTQVPESWSDLHQLIESGATCPLPASSLYAIAAFENKIPFINFTPSIGSNFPAIEELALKNSVCHMGRDGKTGETLMKSVLAPMFAARNLEVMSWVGHNILGNRDGQVLDDPNNKKSKVQSKDQLLGQVLGYNPQTLVSIEYIKSLGDWKTAWDHIHFRGFLNTPMTLQFTWQGSDSMLAAPLAIDLMRFAEFSARHGESGLLTHLSCFFKSPSGVSEHDFGRQFLMLENWAQKFN